MLDLEVARSGAWLVRAGLGSVRLCTLSRRMSTDGRAVALRLVAMAIDHFQFCNFIVSRCGPLRIANPTS